MVLYTCAAKKIGASGPLGKHPCGLAAKALDEAGHRYELKTVGGFKNIPFTTRGGQRDQIVALTGQKDVPVLVLPDDTVIDGHREIIDWAKANPAG